MTFNDDDEDEESNGNNNIPDASENTAKMKVMLRYEKKLFEKTR